jgi:malate dehydrogenase
MRKVAIIGAGRVGESTAQILAKDELCREIVLVDVRPGAAEGTALDIQETAPLFGFDTRVTGSEKLDVISDSDLIVVTAGMPRKPGMSRSDVLEANLDIMDSILEGVIRYAPDSLLLIVSNPVDVLTYYAWKKTAWGRNRVFGQAGVLDSSRLASFVAMETGLSVHDISALVLGGHGDTMVPLVRYTSVNGIPIEHFLDQASIERIIQRTRVGGGEILALKKNSSAYDAPAASVAAMVSAISRNRKRVLPCVAVLEGEYEQHGIAIGVPVVLGALGLERVIELALNVDEQNMFASSVNMIRDDISKLGELRS